VGGVLDEPALLKKTADPPPESEPREMLPGFCWKAQFLSQQRVTEIPPEKMGYLL